MSSDTFGGRTVIGHRVEGHRVHVLQLMPAAAGWRIIQATARSKLRRSLASVDEIVEHAATAELQDLIAAFALVEKEHRYHGAADPREAAEVQVLQDIQPVVAPFIDSAAFEPIDDHQYVATLGPGEIVDEELRSDIAFALVWSLADYLDLETDEVVGALELAFEKHGLHTPYDDDEDEL